MSHDGDTRAIERLLLRSHCAMAHARTRRMRGLGIGSAGALALAHLVAEQRLTPVELGRLLRIGAAETATLIELLEQEGFVRRREPVTVGRALLLTPTPLACALLADADPVAPVALEPAAEAALARFVAHAAALTEQAVERALDG